MRHAMLAIVVLATARAAELPERLQALLEASPLDQRGVVGVLVADAATGRTLFAHNAARHFVPASNTKLFTTALALLRLGADYRYRTSVVAPAAPDADGRLAGPLTLAGGGDPNLSGRTLPYRYQAPSGDPLAAIEDLAAQVAARGVRRIDGDIVGDDSAYVWEPYPDGWSVDDPNGESGAPVSALSVGDNVVTVTLRSGDPARLSVTPALEYFHFDNRVREGTPGRIWLERDLGSRQVRVWGLLAPRGVEVRRLAVDDPAEYAALALRDALGRRGVEIRGEARARHAYAGSPAAPAEGVELARRISEPLLEALRVADKASQNLHAEMLLREVGRVRRRDGSREAGLAELKTLLSAAGIEASEASWYDGSGLSRLNLVTPAALVKLLLHVWQTDQRAAWLSLLPVAGEDGTLAARFKRTPPKGTIRAKTGTLAHTTALSGYAERPDGSTYAFSIVANNQNAPAAEVRAFVDKLAVAILE